MEKEIRLARVAQRQFQVFSGAQAVRAGFSRDAISVRTRSERWVMVSGDAYVAAGTPITLQQLVMATLLTIGKLVALSHESALAWWGLSGSHPDEIRVSVPWTRRPNPEGVLVVRTRRWSPFEIARLGPIPIVSPYRALLDSSPALPEPELEKALDTAHLKGLVDIRRLVRYLDEAKGHKIPGASRLAVLASFRDPDRPIESGLETEVCRLVRLSGLPKPVPQYWIVTRRGKKRRIDFAYPAQKVALHAESVEFHGGRQAFEDDRARDFELVELGWERIPLTRTLIAERPTDVVVAIGTALGLKPRRWYRPPAGRRAIPGRGAGRRLPAFVGRFALPGRAGRWSPRRPRPSTEDAPRPTSR